MSSGRCFPQTLAVVELAAEHPVSDGHDAVRLRSCENSTCRPSPATAKLSTPVRTRCHQHRPSIPNAIMSATPISTLSNVTRSAFMPRTTSRLAFSGPAIAGKLRPASDGPPRMLASEVWPLGGKVPRPWLRAAPPGPLVAGHRGAARRERCADTGGVPCSREPADCRSGRPELQQGNSGHPRQHPRQAKPLRNPPEERRTAGRTRVSRVGARGTVSRHTGPPFRRGFCLSGSGLLRTPVPL
jgi:hypothetical protein